MGTDRTGLVAMLEDADAGEALLADDAEQLELLGMSLPENRRGRGRPAGQRNLRVQRIADYLLTRYRDPLEGLVQMAALGVEDLAAALGCTKAQAFAEKRLCAMACLPYLHSRQPIAVDVTNRQIVHLAIFDGGEAEAQDVDSGDAGVILTIEGNQSVSGEPDGTV